MHITVVLLKSGLKTLSFVEAIDLRIWLCQGFRDRLRRREMFREVVSRSLIKSSIDPQNMERGTTQGCVRRGERKGERYGKKRYCCDIVFTAIIEFYWLTYHLSDEEYPSFWWIEKSTFTCLYRVLLLQCNKSRAVFDRRKGFFWTDGPLYLQVNCIGILSMICIQTADSLSFLSTFQKIPAVGECIFPGEWHHAFRPEICDRADFWWLIFHPFSINDPNIFTALFFFF